MWGRRSEITDWRSLITCDLCPCLLATQACWRSDLFQAGLSDALFTSALSLLVQPPSMLTH
jgi:hypothetical protein